MSLRDALKTAVARCTPLPMQHATFARNDATGDATTVQQRGVNPHEIRVSHATAYATGLQLAPATNATRGGKLQVADASECNMQPGSLTVHRITAAMLAVAMKVCDRHGDDETARQEMRDQCMAVPPHLHADLLAHFNRDGLAQLGDPPDPATNSGIRPATGLPKRSANRYLDGTT